MDEEVCEWGDYSLKVLFAVLSEIEQHERSVENTRLTGDIHSTSLHGTPGGWQT